MDKHLIHKNSNILVDGKPKLPLNSVLEYGEIAINYSKDNETISLKNSMDEIVSFKSDKVNDIRYVNVSGDTMTGALNIQSTLNVGTNNTITGLYTFAQGSGNTASGHASHAEGHNTIANGDYSHAENYNSKANGNYSHAEGYGTTASGYASHVEGWYTEANGNYSHAEGSATTANGDASHAEGRETIASGRSSHAEGWKTKAISFGSHAEGRDTIASGGSCHAEGSGTITSEMSSHAEGHETRTNGYASHAEGSNTIAKGECSHAEGFSTLTNGWRSHAEGGSTIANGECSHAEGFRTISNNYGEHASGYYNVSILGTNPDTSALTKDAKATLFSVGNGDSDTTRKNALEIKGNGDVYISGDTKFAKGISATTITSPSLDAKQNTLVSGTNIKTINGESILGGGDIVIGGGSSYNISDGLSLVVPNILSVKINPSSENYITCDSNGILISGIDVGLDNAIKSAGFNAIDIAASASTKAKDAAILASSLDASAKSTKAKDDAIAASSLNTDTKIDTAKTIILSEAANDASIKSTKAKDDAIAESLLNIDTKLGTVKSELSNLVTVEANRAIGAETNLTTALNGKVSNVELLQDISNTLHYSLIVDNVKKGDINIPTNQFLKSATYDTATKELIFIFDSTTGEIVSKIDIADLVDTYLAGDGLSESLNTFSIKLDPVSESYISVSSDGVKVYGINKALSDLSTDLVSKINDVTVIVNGEISRAIAAEGLNATNLSNYKNEIKGYVDGRFNEILTSIGALSDRLALLEAKKTVLSEQVRTIVPMTTAEYEALPIKEESTLYTLTD